ncbi:MAG TPA: TadE family protein [Terriglobales bacterium]|nr:TadE family protein [Terriglobales bacterium]
MTAMRTGSFRNGNPGRSRRGSQIVEFAMVLPLFMVFTIAAFDFGHVFSLRDKLDNSAREGARLAAALPLLGEVSGSTPSGNTTAVAQSVFSYLQQAKVVQGCALDAGATSGTFSWTFTATGCPDNLSIAVERNYLVTVNGNNTSMSRVTVSYPAHFLFFHRVIGLLTPGANYPSTFVLTPQAVMQNP